MQVNIQDMLIGFVAACAIGIGGVVVADLNSYMSRGGEVGTVPVSWPASVEAASPLVRRSDGGWTFVLTAHPECPCTRATADQLLRALDGADPADRLLVLARADDTNDLGVLEPLRRLSNTTFIADPDASLSADFGGLTSGYLVAFDPGGRTAFAGGLTPRRGMVGPSTGFEAVRALIENKGSVAERAEVFGCPLCEHDAAEK